MNIVRLQHIIPRYYLERFCENEHIYIFDKNSKKGYSKNITKIATSYYYSSKEEQMLTENNTEKYMSKYESKFSINSSKKIINNEKYDENDIIDEIWMFFTRGKMYRKIIDEKVKMIVDLLKKTELFNELKIEDFLKKVGFFELLVDVDEEYRELSYNLLLKIFNNYLENNSISLIKEIKINNLDDILKEMKKFVSFFFNNESLTLCQKNFLKNNFSKILKQQTIGSSSILILEFLYEHTTQKDIKIFLGKTIYYQIEYFLNNINVGNKNKIFTLENLVRKIHEEDIKKILNKSFSFELKNLKIINFNEDIFTSDNPCFALENDIIFYLISPKKAIILSNNEDDSFNNFNELEIKKIIYKNAIEYVYFKNKAQLDENIKIIDN